MNYADLLIDLARVLRRAGMDAGPEQTRVLVRAVALLDPLDREQVRAASRACCCTSPEQVAAHDRVFDAFFDGLPTRSRSTTTVEQTVAMPDERSGGAGEAEGTPLTTSASRAERLSRTDLIAPGPDREKALALVDSLRLTPPVRRSARYRRASRGPVDRRGSARAALRAGGEPATLRHHRHRPRFRRIVVVVDVSGSMRRHTHLTLRFARRLMRGPGPCEVFTAGTQLTRVTEILRGPWPAVHPRMGREVLDLSGGTRLGDVLAELVDGWGRRGPLRGAVLVVVSDGWETGGTEQLARQAARLHRLAHRFLWVNPQAGRDRYRPDTAGMRAVAPSVDRLLGGHTLAHLQEALQLIGAAALPVGAHGVPRA